MVQNYGKSVRISGELFQKQIAPPKYNMFPFQMRHFWGSMSVFPGCLFGRRVSHVGSCGAYLYKDPETEWWFLRIAATKFELQPPFLVSPLKIHPRFGRCIFGGSGSAGVKAAGLAGFWALQKGLIFLLVFLSCSCGCYSCSNITMEVAYTVGIYISMTMFDSFGLCISYRYLCRIDTK